MKEIEKSRKRTDTERRLKQADRVARSLRILQLISGRGRWNIQDLAAELECSERTVYRDLEVLELAGVKPDFDAAAGCYRVRPDYRFPVLNLTDEETLGQAVAGVTTEAAGLKIGSGAKATSRKLAEVSGEETEKLLADAERVVAILDLKLADHSRHREIIRTLQWALLRKKQVAGTYASPFQDRAVKLMLCPVRLCLVRQAWYLVASPSDSGVLKTYRVPRFKTLRMTDARADVPENFDLKAYFGNAWGVYRGDQRYQVELAFTRAAAPLVTETHWHHTQKLAKQKDGGVHVSFEVDGLEEILWWVLGWAGRVEVLQPRLLRERVAEQLRQALRMNEP